MASLLLTEETTESRMSDLLATCREMITLARGGDWQRVAELEQRRSIQLKTCFSAPVPACDVSVIQVTISEVRRLNEDLVLLATAARDRTGDELRQVRYSRQAVGTYGESSA